MSIRTVIVTLLASIVTPWVVFVATTNSLFLANQADLGYDLGYYVPFVIAFAVVWGLGFLLSMVTAEREAAWTAVWAYLLSGIAALLFMSTAGNPTLRRYETAWLVGLLALVGIGAFALRRLSPIKAAPLFALYAVFLIGTDAVRFVRNFEFSVPDKPTASAPSGPSTALDGALEERPTVYHLLLDGYQSDVFPLTLDEAARKELAGFTWFTDNITVSGRTRISIPSVFGGRTWDNNDTIAEYTDEAMNSPRSLLHALDQAGYRTTAYLHKRFSFEPNLFDEVFYHHNATHYRDFSDGTFFGLWAYRYLPRMLSSRMLDEQTLIEIRHLNLSPNKYATVSYDIFRDFISRESELPAGNRYVFLHLILPHHPYVLDRTCRYGKRLEPIEQFHCATQIILDLVRHLKELGRYDDAMIVAQGDHGLAFTVHDDGTLEDNPFEAGGIEWNRPRSKALLLVKPPAAAQGRLAEVDAATTLLDVTPTVYQAINMPAPPGIQGRPLFPRPADRQATRFYHYFESDYTEELYRFAADERFRFDRIVRPAGFHDAVPVLPVEQIVEAEDAYISDTSRTDVTSTQPGSSGMHVSSGSIFFKVRVEHPGDYGLDARVCTSEGDRKGFMVSLNEAKYEPWRIPAHGSWQWESSPFRWRLDAGEHLVIIRQLGPTLIDQLRLRRL